MYHFVVLRPRALLLAASLALLGGCVGMPAVGDADVSDPGILANIEATLRSQKGLKLDTVTIDVHSRIVTISGLIDTYEHRGQILRAVKQTRGIEQVIDNLIVQD